MQLQTTYNVINLAALNVSVHCAYVLYSSASYCLTKSSITPSPCLSLSLSLSLSLVCLSLSLSLCLSLSVPLSYLNPFEEKDIDVESSFFKDHQQLGQFINYILVGTVFAPPQNDPDVIKVCLVR